MDGIYFLCCKSLSVSNFHKYFEAVCQRNLYKKVIVILIYSNYAISNIFPVSGKSARERNFSLCCELLITLVRCVDDFHSIPRDIQMTNSM